ncbi:hypothetical protein FQR65_LT16043 [Abscondita terminalis]|nr:hypothetical protein FQR65_LT16043 [Abscondita terminalis]
MKQKLLSFLVGTMILTSVAFGQEKKISGKVTSATGQALPGVTVVVQGTTLATQTDANGNYTLNVPAGKTLRPHFNVSFEDQDNALAEVVVTANAIKREKRTLGYSAPTLNNEELTSGKNASAINSLAGETQRMGQAINGVRQTKPYSAVKNNVRDFFDLGVASDNNLSLSGGGEKTTFYLGLNSLNSNGVYPVHIGGGQGGGSVYNNLLQTPQRYPVSNMSDLTNPYNGYGQVRDAAGNLREDLYGYYGAYAMNPYWMLDNYNNFNDVNRIMGNVNVGYKPFEWLDIKERIGVDHYSDRRRSESPKFTYSPADNTTDNYSQSKQQAELNRQQLVMDWLQHLPKANNSFFYPSVSGSFVFSELMSPEARQILSYGKLRANIAKVGNDTDPYQLSNISEGEINADWYYYFPFVMYQLNVELHNRHNEKKILKHCFLAGICDLWALVSCNKYLDINENPNNPEKSDPSLLLPTVEAALSQVVGNQFQTYGNMWAQYWTQNPSSSQYQTIDCQYNMRGTKFRSGMGLHMTISCYSVHSESICFSTGDRCIRDVPLSEALKAGDNLKSAMKKQQVVYG